MALKQTAVECDAVVPESLRKMSVWVWAQPRTMRLLESSAEGMLQSGGLAFYQTGAQTAAQPDDSKKVRGVRRLCDGLFGRE